MQSMTGDFQFSDLRLFSVHAHLMIYHEVNHIINFACRYREISENCVLIKWLWKTLEELNREERVLFLKFVSGRSRLPAVAADIPQRFQVMKVDKVRSFVI